MEQLTIDGVTFICSECLKMPKEEFVDAMKDVHWPKREEKAKIKTLEMVYDKMKPKAEKKD